MTGLPVVSLRHHALVLVACLIIAALPGVIGAQFQPGPWYADLAKSSLTPPGWVFPVVWTTLYILIGLSLYLFLLHAPDRRRAPLVLFGVQLVLNGAWSWVFFGLHSIGGALVVIVALALAILATLDAFARVSRAAGALLVPYLVWVSFASYLNFAIWRAN